MTIAIDPKGTFEFIDDPDRDLPADDPNRTVWEYRVLTPTEEAAIQDAVSMAGMGEGETTSTSGYGTIAHKTLRLGLVGVKNFRDAEGNEILLDSNARQKGSNGTPFVKDVFLARIPSGTRSRLCNAITSHGSMTEDEEKKQ